MPSPETVNAFLHSTFTGSDEERVFFDEVIFLPGYRAHLRSSISPSRPHPTEADWMEVRQQYRKDLEAERGAVNGRIEFFRGDLLGVDGTKRMLAAGMIEIWRYDSLGTLWFKVVRREDAE